MTAPKHFSFDSLGVMKMKRSRPARMSEVARLAGVSVTTVSYVLNNRGHISPETAARVREAAQALHYRPSVQGRSLVQGRSHVVGIVMPSPRPHTDLFFTEFLGGVTESCQRLGYHLMLINPDEVQRNPSYLVDIFLSRRVDGMILLDLPDETGRDELLATLHEASVPTALFGLATRQESFLDVDHLKGGWMATKHLIDLGHRHIAHIAGPESHPAYQLRREGYLRALQEIRLDHRALVVYGDGSTQSGYLRMYELLTGANRPTAVFTGNAAMGLGALQAANHLGFVVPRHVSVIGFGDANIRSIPSLTTIQYGAFRAGERLAEMVIRRIDGHEAEEERVLPALKIRESTGVLSMFATPKTDPYEPVLKSGPSFAVFSPNGTIDPAVLRHGIYLGDTRMVSRYQVRINGETLEPLSQQFQDNALLLVYLNQKPGHTRRMERTIRLFGDRLEDVWSWQHWGPSEPWFLSLRFDSDFRDMFEVRGVRRVRSGQHHIDRIDGADIHRYEGLDHIKRTVRIESTLPFSRDQAGEWMWAMADEAKEGHLKITVSWENPVISNTPPCSLGPWPKIDTGNPSWNEVFRRAFQDIELLLTDFGHGPVPMAGLPWFGTFFGRDSIIVSYQTLSWAPSVSRASLRMLAALQGQNTDETREEERGKIIHEIRLGEMARTGEIPFGRYYGSVDVTPLFVRLFVDTWKRTGDSELLHELLPHAEQALGFILQSLEKNPYGLYSFLPRSDRGLTIQSWKDSHDSMVFQDGRHAEPPLAVAEVQGYAFRALLEMASLYRWLGRKNDARDLSNAATDLQSRFQQFFWVPSREYYALAVDGRGHPVDSLTSDPGQCLWSGIIPDEFREPVQKRLISPELFTGWGIRTMGSQEGAYDPYSYHRGSVWPHDTSLIVAGMKEAGYSQNAWTVGSALLEAAKRFPKSRVPEVFSGEPRGAGNPLPYPESCSPQAWSAGSGLLILESFLGLKINHTNRTVTLNPVPDLPPLTIDSIPLGKDSDPRLCLRYDGKKFVIDGLPLNWTIHYDER